uniref:Uncharacterized protein n=1 Tax=Vombatus ursinus TaxID=29139 RepID=A0A4X2LV11_VOMUR
IETALLGFTWINLSFSLGTPNTHLNLASITSLSFTFFHSTSLTDVFHGVKIVFTMNLCLLLSFGSQSKDITEFVSQCWINNSTVQL